MKYTAEDGKNLLYLLQDPTLFVADATMAVINTIDRAIREDRIEFDHGSQCIPEATLEHCNEYDWDLAEETRAQVARINCYVANGDRSSYDF